MAQAQAAARDQDEQGEGEQAFGEASRADVSGVFDDENTYQSVPVVGVLGCMGERLKEKILERDGLADLVAGPDAYRDLPRLIDAARGAVDGDAFGGALETPSAGDEGETGADAHREKKTGATKDSSKTKSSKNQNASSSKRTLLSRP